MCAFHGCSRLPSQLLAHSGRPLARRSRNHCKTTALPHPLQCQHLASYALYLQTLFLVIVVNLVTSATMFGTHAPNHAPNHVHTRTQHYQNPFPPYTPLATISIEDVQLWIRQEPREALLCLDGKEKGEYPPAPCPASKADCYSPKARRPASDRPGCDQKPFRPHAVSTLRCAAGPRLICNRHFLQSPYLFMCASLWHPDSDEPWRSPPSKTLAGSVVSSLHRLKDIDNKDGAFFVFGDISVKTKGRYRLQFSLFDYQK